MKLKSTVNDIRLDKFLSENTDYSRSLIAKMIDNELILVNNMLAKVSYKVKENDEIEILGDLNVEQNIEPVKMNLDIIFEDEHLMVINKPSGLVVHPGSGNYDNTLVNGLLYYTKNLSDINSNIRPGIVHRLDKDTSGLMIVAKTNKAHELLAEGFKNKTIKREYIALIDGVFKHNKAIIDAPIGRDPKNRQRMTVINENSKDAITNLTVLKRFKEHTLINLLLETGRTHQIRVHLNYIGYPVHNDPLYGINSKNTTDFAQFLHSYKLAFIHPITNEPLQFEIPLPEIMEETIAKLEL